MAANASMLLLKFPQEDSQFSVTRSTLQSLATRLEMSEVDVIHLALARLTQDQPPSYAPDDGPLSDEVLAALRVHASATHSQRPVVSRKMLF